MDSVERSTEALQKLDKSRIVRYAGLLASSKQPVYTAGVGKSGIAAEYAAKMLRTVGLPAIYLHAEDAFHGELGGVVQDASLIAFSHSGETPQTCDLAIYDSFDFICAITHDKESKLAKSADYVIPIPGCDPDLPFSSMTQMIAIVSLICENIGWDYHQFHPRGELFNG